MRLSNPYNHISGWQFLKYQWIWMLILWNFPENNTSWFIFIPYNIHPAEETWLQHSFISGQSISTNLYSYGSLFHLVIALQKPKSQNASKTTWWNPIKIEAPAHGAASVLRNRGREDLLEITLLLASHISKENDSATFWVWINNHFSVFSTIT
jgi:hypothetical protein